MSSFPGVNASMYWFMAIVENIYDPDMAGKIKIRVIGKDTSDTMATPSESLPWAPCLLPANFSRKTIDVEPGDWVVATGETRSVRDMCKYVFGKLELNYEDYVIQNQKFLRPEELPYLKGDSTKIRTELGWRPEYTFEMLMDEMIEHWMQYFTRSGK